LATLGRMIGQSAWHGSGDDADPDAARGIFVEAEKRADVLRVVARAADLMVSEARAGLGIDAEEIEEGGATDGDDEHAGDATPGGPAGGDDDLSDAELAELDALTRPD